MARRRKSQPTTVQARDLALSIRQGERAGLKQKEIAAVLGINERTVRKIKSGQTSGRKTYRRLTTTPRGARATPNAFNAEFVVGYDSDGNPIIGSANIIVADVTTRTGERRAPTPLDVFRVQGLADVAARERAAMARRYNVEAMQADLCTRSYCRHEPTAHTPDAEESCMLCRCPHYKEPQWAVRLRSIGTMRKPAAAILHTGTRA